MNRPTQDPNLAAQLRPIIGADGTHYRDPLLIRASWPDPHDKNPLRREAVQVDGVVRYTVVRDLHRRTPSDVTVEMLGAALRFAADWELSDAGYAMTADYGQGGSRAAIWAGNPADRAVDAIGRVRSAMAALRGIEDVVLHIVVGNWTVKRWAKRRGCNEKVAKGFLIAALMVLVVHYGDEVANRDAP